MSTEVKINFNSVPPTITACSTQVLTWVASGTTSDYVIFILEDQNNPLAASPLNISVEVSNQQLGWNFGVVPGQYLFEALDSTYSTVVGTSTPFDVVLGNDISCLPPSLSVSLSQKTSVSSSSSQFFSASTSIFTSTALSQTKASFTTLSRTPSSSALPKDAAQSAPTSKNTLRPNYVKGLSTSSYHIPPATTSLSQNENVSSPSSTPMNSAKISKVGGTIGAIIGLLVISLSLYIYHKRRRRHKSMRQLHSAGADRVGPSASRTTPALLALTDTGGESQLSLYGDVETNINHHTSEEISGGPAIEVLEWLNSRENVNKAGADQELLQEVEQASPAVQSLILQSPSSQISAAATNSETPSANVRNLRQEIRILRAEVEYLHANQEELVRMQNLTEELPGYDEALQILMP